MWTERQEALQTFHEEQLAWRLLPENKEKIAYVLKHFPHAVFFGKDGREATLDYDRLQLPDWPAPISFKDITALKLEDAWMKNRLTITHRQADQPKPVKTRCNHRSSRSR